MLDVMRRQSFLIYSVFGAIIVILAVNFGPGSGGCAQSLARQTWVARVNGERIGQEEFLSRLGQQFDTRRRSAEENGVKFDAAMLERAGIRRFVVDRLVEQRLLAQEAKRRGILVSDDELVGFLQAQYGLQNFSFQTYEDYVGHTYNTTVTRFEDMVRQELANARLSRVVADSMDVSQAALKQSFAKEHDRARITYLRLPIETQDVPVPAAAQVARILQEDPKAVQDAYERDLMHYQTPERVQLRHIVAKVAPGAPAEVAETVRLKMMELRQKLIDGADFAALAKEHSEDADTRDRGGDLGLLARSEMAPDVAAAVFSQPDGALAGPLRSADGWLLVQKVAAKPEGILPLEEVREQVARALLREQVAAGRAEQKAEGLRQKLLKGLPWERISRGEDDQTLSAGGNKGPALLPTRVTSRWIRRVDEELPRIGVAPDLQAAIFLLAKPGAVAPRVFRVGEAVYVVALKERERPDWSQFAGEEGLLREEARGQKRRRVFAAWLAYLRSQAKVDIHPASILPALPQTADEGHT